MTILKVGRAAVAGLAIALLTAPAAFAETNTGDTAWVLTATALVLLMTLPALALFYGGLVQSKNVLSVLSQCVVIACLMSLLHGGHREQLHRAHVDRAPSLPAGRLVECVEVALGDEVVRDACDEVGREPQGLLVHPHPVPVRKWRSTQRPQKRQGA